MISTRAKYNELIIEIDYFFAVLSQLDAELTDYSREYAESIEGYKQDNFLKILKANALLMIYNLVESTVSNGIEEIYDKLNANNATYSTVRKEIQDIWFSFKFGQVYQPEAHFRSYKNKALEIINSIVIGETIELSGKALRFEGNLDADEIRKVCDVHGIEFRPDDTCRGGERLKDVKTKRNDLAHGTLSFAECGRDYSLEDLEEIKKQTYAFLSGLLDGMHNYYDTDGFLSGR